VQRFTAVLGHNAAQNGQRVGVGVAGRLIVIEGLDGAGTTTLAGRLVAALRHRGVEVELEAEPTRGPFGATLRQALEGRLALDPVAFALGFAADRADHIANPIRGITKTLDQGTWVVSDRYVASSIAYQASQGLDAAWLAAINRHARRPDLTVFVDTPVEECLRRSAARSGHADLFERRESLEAVLGVYHRLIDEPDLAGSMTTVDGTAPAGSLAEQVMALMAERGLL
jgi:dTMP kinase